MATLDRAIELASAYHAGQLDKAGEPYILHPLRVMLSLTGETERIVVVLHDIIEDTAATVETLETCGFSREVVYVVDLLTHAEGEPYVEYIDRIARHPIAARVKLADLADNMNLDRLPDPSETDWQRYVRYRQARAVLRERGRE
jgi:(p)ppGpp synthase/HD superfamily hydrolase